jgi:hypothetical protein
MMLHEKWEQRTRLLTLQEANVFLGQNRQGIGKLFPLSQCDFAFVVDGDRVSNPIFCDELR